MPLRSLDTLIFRTGWGADAAYIHEYLGLVGGADAEYIHAYLGLAGGADAAYILEEPFKVQDLMKVRANVKLLLTIKHRPVCANSADCANSI